MPISKKYDIYHHIYGHNRKYDIDQLIVFIEKPFVKVITGIRRSENPTRDYLCDQSVGT